MIVRHAALRLSAFAGLRFLRRWLIAKHRRGPARELTSPASGDVKASSNSGDIDQLPPSLSPYRVTASECRDGTQPLSVVPWTLNSVVSSSDGARIPNPTWNSPASNRRMPKAPFAGADASMPSSMSQRGLSRCRAASAKCRRLKNCQAAATAVRQVSIAAARSVRCVWAEVRWRWTLKML